MGGLSEQALDAAGEAPGDVPADVLAARAYLSRIAEPGSLDLWRFVGEHGPVESARLIRSGRVSGRVAGLTEARRAAIDPAGDLEAAQRHGIRLVVPESPDWPHFALAALERTGAELARRPEGCERVSRPDGGDLVPPLALWVKGDLDLSTLAMRGVALVGSRAATAYGEQVTAELAYALARRAVTVVSGGAFGIDATAHRSALAAEGDTVIVSAGGLDRPYPSGNAVLFERAAESGLLVSESPPGAAPQRHRFLSRNRLIAAFATGTVVVEAARRSGSLNTATHARRLGRVVMAVPGPVTSMMSVGCHDLLVGRTSGGAEVPPATLVASADDVLAAVGSIGEGLSERSAAGTADSRDLRGLLDQLDPVARRVFDALPLRQGAREDELAVISGVSALDVIRAIPALHLAGLVEAAEDGYRVAPDIRRRVQPGARPSGVAP